MAKSEPQPSFPRLARFNLGLNLRPQSSQSRASRRTTEKRDEEDSDDWYIPYHGPYEKRKNSPELRPRDSWGDLIHTNTGDAILGDPDLHSRYENHDDGGNHSDPDRAGSSGNRVLSGISHQTASSSAIDPSRRSIVSRSTMQRQQTSYGNMDVVGGVGESPTPPQRLIHTSPRGSNGNRGIANFFGPTKKVGPVPPRATHDHDPDARLSQPKSLYSLLRNNSGSEGKRDNHKARNRRENTLAVDTHFASPPVATADGAYYDSYYSTLLSTPKGDDQFSVPFPQADTGHPFSSSSLKYQGRHLVDVPSSINSPTSISSRPLAIHPYAHAFPAAPPPRPRTAPASANRHQFQDPGPSNQPHQRILLTGPRHPAGGYHASHTALSRPNTSNPPQPLKSSISSPDLYGASRKVDNPNASGTKASSSTSKDRWLSIETWCDAILFPRPKFQLKHGGKENRPIVSPPGSPIGNGATHKNNIPGIQSRVLLHSRSHAELRPSTETNSSSIPLIARRRGATLPSGIVGQSPFNQESSVVEATTARPKTSTQDDMAVPSPVPSLVRVIEEGQQLDEMRKQWQAQATQSFQNKRTRSLSRTRSKSLTSGNPMTGRKEGEGNKVMESIDFLAARSFLGNQIIMPTVIVPKSVQRAPEKGTGVGTLSSNSNSISHSHSNSLNKNSSKSSKGSVHRGHSRNASWGQSALKIAKSTAASLCGFSDTSLSTPPDDKTSALEGELKGDRAQLTSMGDQESKPLLPRKATNVVHYPDTYADMPPDPFGASPVPSANFETVGIALSTPPPDDRTNPSQEPDPIRLPDHPYGQSGLYSRPHTAPTVSYRLRDSWRGSDYAGPHPSLSKIAHGNPNDVSARHRLPPQAVLHPYAQTNTSDNHGEDTMKAYLRVDSQVPPRDKMWAQLSPSGLQEILPADIVYSPYDNPPVYPSPSSGENGEKGCSTVSVGEALTSTMRGGTTGDSGLGTSEGHDIMYPPPVIRLEGTVREEPEDHDIQKRREDLMTTAPLQVGRVRHPYGTTFLEPMSKPTPTTSESTLESPQADNGQSSGSSPGLPSQSSSPQISPRPLGSMDDLDHFRDLFYKPNSARTSYTELAMQAASPRGPVLPWEIRSHRTGSGLTSLARKLSEELEELNAQLDPSERASYAGTSSDQGGLRFVLSEARDPNERVSSLRITTERDKLSAFQPSDNIPEDVESSGGSSFLQRSPVEDEDITLPFRVGVVESVATPVATTSPRRASGHLSLVNEESVSPAEPSATSPHSRIRSQATLPPPSADATRSSYMTTTSTNGSRMSGLSDFPAPPGDIMAHMKVLDTYFETGSVEMAEVPSEGSPPAPVSRRMTFGGDEDIEDIAKALSNL